MLSFEFFCDLRGFRLYCAKWKPRVADKIMIFHGKGNPHEENAMAGTTTLPGTLAPSIIGHVPRKCLVLQDILQIMMLQYPLCRLI